MNIISSTIQDLLINAQKAYGDQDAFRYLTKHTGIDGKKTTKIETKSYTQLKYDSACFSNALSFLGEQGKHIALLGSSSYAWVTAYFGIVNSGSVAVPLDAQLPVKDLCELINRADVTALVYDENRADVANIVTQECPQVEHLISIQKNSVIENALYLWELIKQQQPIEDCKIEPDMLATIMFTSGTTGKSKGVMLTHRNMAENATCLDMKFKPQTVLLSVLPIHHAYCLSMDILKGLSTGAVICINDSLMHVARNIKTFQPNIILMVPLMIEAMAKKLEEAAKLPVDIVKENIFGSQFEMICSGGAYLNPAYIELFQKYNIQILQGYGMTECAPVISTNLLWEHKIGSVGKLMPNCQAKTVDEELWVKGSSVMQGYYKMPEETAAALEDGWLKTGDLGYVDADGFVYLTGRKKNLIITPNGENVSPEEIENKIGADRLVQEILVRDSKGVIEAEIFPDYEYASKMEITDIQSVLQKIIDTYNSSVPIYKRVLKLKLRETEFEKNTTKKIKRF